VSDAELPVLRATWATLQLAPSLRQPALSYLLSRPPAAALTPLGATGAHAMPANLRC
jgi:hypothetical protein